MCVLKALKILFMGLVDGITSFFPISSSGHQAVLNNVFDFGVGDSLLFDSLLSLSIIIVIILGFKKDFVRLIKAFAGLLVTGAINLGIWIKNIFSQEKESYLDINSTYMKMALMILLATISTGIIGCFGRSIAVFASSGRWLVATDFVFTGVMLFLISNKPLANITIKEATFLSAYIIGAVQGLSVMPGMSRCGLVIATCLLFGYEAKLTRRFVFLVAIPSLIGKIVLNVFDMIEFGVKDISNIVWYLLASLLAMISGYFGLRIINKAIKKQNYLFFSIYCLVAGAFVFASIFVL